MTDEEYYLRVRQLGLKPTAIQTVWITLEDNFTVHVQLPKELDDHEKLRVLAELSNRLGKSIS